MVTTSAKNTRADLGGMEVVYRKVSELRPYAKNSRTHSLEQVAKIAASIKAFGWTNPILVDGDNGLLAGHGRLQAAILLEMVEVPTIELKGLSDVQKRAYVVADNQIALNAGWDFDLLQEEMTAIEASGLDIALLGDINIDPVEVGDPLAAQVWKAAVIKFNITFDNDLQQQTWFEFVRRLQQEYPYIETLAGRLIEFLKLHGPDAQPRKAA